jgi:cytochrome b involved in lipid metabolism
VQQAPPQYYTPEDIADHNCAKDCWVSSGHKVLDLTKLIADNRGPLAEPIIAAAGRDISHWFNEKTGSPRTCVDAVTGLTVAYTPDGRYVHVPPAFPTTTWRTDFGTPWWHDEKYIIGKLTRRARYIRVVNILTQQEDDLRVASEDTIAGIQRRYNSYNSHAASYTWKALRGDVFVPLDLDLTLAQNGVADESAEFERLGALDECSTPVLFIYFNDDLTVA